MQANNNARKFVKKKHKKNALSEVTHAGSQQMAVNILDFNRIENDSKEERANNDQDDGFALQIQNVLEIEPAQQMAPNEQESQIEKPPAEIKVSPLDIITNFEEEAKQLGVLSPTSFSKKEVEADEPEDIIETNRVRDDAEEHPDQIPIKTMATNLQPSNAAKRKSQAVQISEVSKPLSPTGLASTILKKKTLQLRTIEDTKRRTMQNMEKLNNLTKKSESLPRHSNATNSTTQSKGYLARRPSNIMKVLDDYERKNSSQRLSTGKDHIEFQQNIAKMLNTRNEIQLPSSSKIELQTSNMTAEPPIDEASNEHEEFESMADDSDPQPANDEQDAAAGTGSDGEDIDGHTLVRFDDTNINQLIHQDRESGMFANLWAKLILLAQTYNFITVWYFLGIVGFPDSWWLVVELLIELIMVFDFFIRLYLKYRMPNQWRTMWLLQAKEENGGFIFLLTSVIAAFPQSLVFCLIYQNETAYLSSFTVAALRSLKLIRFKQISKFFETKEIENHLNKKKMMVNMRSIQVVFYFLLATHMIGCIWLIIGRIDPNRVNWFVMARYSGEPAANNVREVTIFEKYIDAVFYTVATMTGLGYGNVVPSTNLEYFVDIFIMITGCSIYAGFFADFAVEIYNQNKKTIDNDQKLEQAKQFATQRNLPDEIRQRIRLYYNNLRLNFSVLKDKFQILHQLPLTLRSELSLFFNTELIQRVKFFQLADPSFILTMSRSLTPQICLQKDLVVEVDQVATKMFFIEQGIVQILATDNKTVIAFQSQGCYFGEIGVLLTEKRSCSVKAVTMCIFMTITKEELETIFENYPQQGKFLRAIGRQRLLTTKPEDLIDFEENIFEVEDGETVFVDNIQEKAEDMNKSTILNLTMIAAGIHQDKKPHFDSSSDDSKAPAAAEVKIEKKISHTIKQSQGAASISRRISQRFNDKQHQRQNGVPWHLTENYVHVKQFVIVPFSRLFNWWTIFMTISTSYFIWMVPYQLALNYDIYTENGFWYLLPDIIFSLSFILDIFVRSRIAFIVTNNESDIVTNLDKIRAYYVNDLLIYDFLAAIPFDYLLLPFGSFGLSNELLRFLRIMKFLKIKRISETIMIVKKHSNISNALITFSLLFALYIILAHFMATGYIFIGQREDGKKTRFDGQSMFEDVTGRIFITPVKQIQDRSFEFLKPAALMSKVELYIQFIYLSSCTMGAVMYGDIIPFAMSEQLFDFIAMFTCRMFLAFLFAEAASYLSSVHKSQSVHTKRLQRINDWSNLNQLPQELKSRIVRFYEILWKNFRGVRQQHILKDLPESLRQDVRQHIFKNIVENWDIVLGSRDNGVLSSIVQKLELRIIPQYEFIIKQGEIAQEMYFIIKGQVNIISAEGIHLASLGVGKNFGEMALLEEGNVRTASVQAATDISVAIMSTQDFKQICEVYPTFKERMAETVAKRKAQNKDIIKKVEKESEKIKQQIMLNNLGPGDPGTRPQEKSSSSSSSLDSSEKSEEIKKQTSESHSLSSATTPFEKKQNAMKMQNFGQVAAKDKDDQDITSRTFANESALNIDDSRTARPLISNRKSEIPAGTRKQSELIEEGLKVEIDKQTSEAPPVLTGSALKPASEAKSNLANESLRLNRRISRVPLRAAGIQEHFQDVGGGPEEEQILPLFTGIISGRKFMKWSILFAVVYNIIFIPLQFGYRIDFEGFYLIFEVFTVILYCCDIYFRLRNLRMLQLMGGNIAKSEKEIENHLMDDKDLFNKRLSNLKIEIVCSFLAMLPFSFLFQKIKYHEPLLLVDSLCLIRLVKIYPLIKMFNDLKSNNMQKWRVIEVMVLYYLICHIFTGVWISMGIFKSPDVRVAWVRRIKVPQPLGMRDDPTLNDVSASSIYIHALYFIVNTISHVAIGDITAVNTEERVFVAILILFGTFIYSFLFGNIVSIVSDFAPSQDITYFEKYQYVMQRLGSMKQKESLMAQINEYFDYIWGHEQHSIEEQFMNDLPQCIRSDIWLCKYQEAIEHSLIFKDNSGAIDVSLTNSIFKLMEVRIYMSDEFIFKCGSHSEQTCVVLEGQCFLVGACDQIDLGLFGGNNLRESQIIGVMNPGCHFGNDLPKNKFNYKGKRICHLVSRQPSVIGIISRENLDVLYSSFPSWKEKMQSLNQLTFSKCERHMKLYDHVISNSIAAFYKEDDELGFSTRQKRIFFIEHNLTYSLNDYYKKILTGLNNYNLDDKKLMLETNDLIILHKMYFYGKKGKMFPIFDTEYQEALKQRSHRDLILQMIAGQDNEEKLKKMKVQQEKNLQAKLVKCWKRFYLKVNSRSRKILDWIQILNLLYIAIVTPLLIGYQIQMNFELNIMETLSLLLSSGWVFGNMRTQVLIKGVPTLKFKTLLTHYKHNGLLLDICGMVPFNIILGQSAPYQSGIVIISIVRSIRIFSSWRAVQLFGKAEVSFRNNRFNVIMQVMKATFYIFFLGHFLACLWWFVVRYYEDQTEPTWIDYNKIKEEALYVQYLRSIYTVFNIVCSVGYGDMFPMTDIERIFFAIMITIGDLLFALAFGLITRLTLQISHMNETRQFKDKMYQIQEFMNSFKLDQGQQRRVEQYFAYEYQQKYNSNLLMYNDLVGYLPYGLREEVIYQSCKDLLTSMFKEFNSENLIRQLACVLESVIFLPGDYIIYKGDFGDEMYFIAEGSVFVLSQDKQTVIASLTKGAFFGEIALLMETRRTSYVQAETFCIINILKKHDFDNIAKNFPEIEKKLKERANQRLKEMQLLDTHSETVHEMIDGDCCIEDVLSSSPHHEIIEEESSKQESDSYDQSIEMQKQINKKSSKRKVTIVENANNTDFSQQAKKFSILKEPRKRSSSNLQDPELNGFFSPAEDNGSDSDTDALRKLQKSRKISSRDLSSFIESDTPLNNKNALRKVGRSSSQLLEGFYKDQQTQDNISNILRLNKPDEASQRRNSTMLQQSMRRMQHKPKTSLDPVIEESSLSMASKQNSIKINQNRQKSTSSLSSMFKGAKEEQINHSIRRQSIRVQPPPTQVINRPVRRLSRISLGKNLTLSQTAGLKLQWTVSS